MFSNMLILCSTLAWKLFIWAIIILIVCALLNALALNLFMQLNKGGISIFKATLASVLGVIGKLGWLIGLIMLLVGFIALILKHIHLMGCF